MTEEEWDAISIEKWREKIAKTNPLLHRVSEDERKAFYELVLGIHWLDPEIRSALLKKLGVSVTAQNAYQLRGWARHTQFNIAMRVRRMAENNEAGPMGGRATRAKEAEANSQGISVKAMERRLERLGVSLLHEHFLNDLDKSLGKVNRRKK